ncbi:uncharacterized protein BXZ73DRAFT_79330 [Epithele typhae]|uniref:uncharacterized protein n=1 Tax=Epithele typhae TaxID=378194 RepID=UPI002008A966|nr:uncharacterized protein BXZ73DRAFT_79330 [Epithele typhae]KAH9923925.1 hypothetical protein BXZ73DRAFT_79330 [Epithele typhae]
MAGQLAGFVVGSCSTLVHLNINVKSLIAATLQFARLVIDHDYISANGINLVVQDSTRNLVDRWRSTLERAFSSLHTRNLLHIQFRYSMCPGSSAEWTAPSPDSCGHPSPPNHFIFSLDGHWAASVAFSWIKIADWWSIMLIIWDIRSGACAPEESLTYGDLREMGHIKPPSGPQEFLAASWSPDSAQILVLVTTMEIQIWDAESLVHGPRPESHLSVSPDGRFALVRQRVYQSRPDNHNTTNKFSDSVNAVNLMSDQPLPFLLHLRQPHHSSDSLFQAVLRHETKNGEGSVLLAVTRAGALLVESSPSARGDDPPSSMKLAQALPDGWKPRALSQDGSRVLCFRANSGSDSTYAGSLCVVDAATGRPLSGSFEVESSRGIFVDGSVIHPRYHFAPTQPTGTGRRRPPWYWSTLRGRLYRVPALEGKTIRQLVVTDDGSMVGWSDWHGGVHFERNEGDVIPADDT